ncbi:hypothetical protein B0H10DRAFT_286441 [Mycena sp. CBHHK59/15]|nr:hypothetical protein B0H10DRAFT_286441 [Mycena sp. CBHHK59/15]
MLLHSQPSILKFALLIIAAANLFILCGTWRRFLALNHPKQYTWINKDFPILLPVGDIPTVEMTFQESARFGLSNSDAESQKNWETLVTNQFGVGFQHLGPYRLRYISGAYHSLHCIYTMQLDLNNSNHTEHPSHHFTHCLMYFRQIFMCNADLTLEDGDFLKKNYTTDRSGQTRKCRDWWKVADWVKENSKEWLEFNGVQFP